MAEFSASDAAITGFRVVWLRPMVVPVWAVVQFAVALGSTAFIVASAGPAFAKLQALSFQPAADPNQVLSLFAEVAPTYLVLIAGSLIFYAVLYAAMNRAVLRPEDDGFGYLRLSADELRQLGLFALLAACAMGLYFVVVFAAVPLSLLVGLVAPDAASASALVLAIVAVLAICAFVYFGVRLSLASPLTFATGRISLLGAWALTRGRFWPLLGTYLISLALWMVVLALTLAIAICAVAILGGGFGAIGAMMQADMASLAAVFTPSRLVYQLVLAIGSALGWPIIATPPAAVYRAIAGGAPAVVSKVFD